MNPIQERIEKHIDSLPADLGPLAAVCRRYLKYCSAIDVDQTILIAHQPWQAPLGYAIRLFAPAKQSWFPKYARMHGVKIPSTIQRFLLSLNGCFVFGLSLYGVPPTMVRTPPSLDRSTVQCHDIGAANRDWKYAYRSADDGFHFGSRGYTDTENCGYFLVGGRILSMLRDGSVIGQWDNIRSFLTDEIAASEERECFNTPEGWWQ